VSAADQRINPDEHNGFAPLSWREPSSPCQPLCIIKHTRTHVKGQVARPQPPDQHAHTPDGSSAANATANGQRLASTARTIAGDSEQLLAVGKVLLHRLCMNATKHRIRRTTYKKAARKTRGRASTEANLAPLAFRPRICARCASPPAPHHKPRSAQ
jgi:hypothetical protein